MNIENFLKIDDKIYTSGLPEIEDFKDIKKEGFDIVISLSMPEDSKSLENEELILTKLGITYIHIPVDYLNPKLQDFEFFRKIVNCFKDKKLFIHCTKNFRVSIFMYLYKFAEENIEDEELRLKFFIQNETWEQFIIDVKNELR